MPEFIRKVRYSGTAWQVGLCHASHYLVIHICMPAQSAAYASAEALIRFVLPAQSSIGAGFCPAVLSRAVFLRFAIMLKDFDETHWR